MKQLADLVPKKATAKKMSKADVSKDQERNTKNHLKMIRIKTYGNVDVKERHRS